ncbi:MAG: hypothetical protein RLZZ546_2254 [Bacteroidota bacterium]|jgi:hypothetical protein
MMNNYNLLNKILRILVYFSMILFISSYFEISDCDQGSKILINNIPLSLIFSVAIVLIIEKSMPKN